MTDYQTSTANRRSITAFFDTRAAADKAVSDLVAMGLARGDVTVTGSDAAAATTTGSHEDKGFWESLKELFIPDEDRYAYAEGMRRGGYVVGVRTTDANYDRVLALLDRDGAVDLDQREASWRSEGWKGYSAADSTLVTGTSATAAVGAAMASTTTTAATTRTATPATGLTTGRDEVIPVYEEQITVGKREVNHGRVRVRSYVVETPVSEQVSLRTESVQVERKSVDRPVSATDVMFQDRVIEAEEHAEEAVVAKQARVKEEITLRKTAEDRTQTVSDTVRRTEVEVDDQRGMARTGTAARAFSSADMTRIVAGMDVMGSDGAKIGTVDGMDGTDRIKLAKMTSADGQHHFVPVSWIARVDTHVHLLRTGAEAKSAW